MLLCVARLAVFCVALMPMTLHQAASLSADAVGIGAAFLFFAYTAHLALDPTPARVRAVEIAILAALLLFTTLGKFNLWCAALPLLISAGRFGGRAKKANRVLAPVCDRRSIGRRMAILEWREHEGI